MGHDWDAYISIVDAARMNDHCRVYCANHLCDHSARLDFAPLLERYSPHTGLGIILRSLRCHKCQSRGAHPIMEPGSKQAPARPLFCSIHTDKLHRCDHQGECINECRLGPAIRNSAPSSY